LGLAYLASNGQFATPQHVHLIADRLCQLARGEIKRLMVFCPPRHGKSELCSKYFPAWYIGAFAGRVILTSYESTFAATWGRLARNVLTEWGPVIWPGLKVAQDSSAADHWELDGAQGQKGVMYTAGVGAAITGKGASLLIIDDPVKNMEEANSLTMREKAWLWYTSTAYTRLEPDARVLVIQTRWHHDDLSGRILANAKAEGDTEPWHVLSLPAIAEADEEYATRGRSDSFRRHEGEALWPDRFNIERLAAIRQDVGSSVWASLYQQRPVPDGGMIWHREWFKRYTELPPLTRKIQSIDTAFQTGVASDYSVIATWGRTETDYYLIDLWRARVEYPELKRAIVDQYRKHEPEKIYIEKAASGQSAFQEIRRESDLPIFAVPPQGSKESRAAAVCPLGEAGHVWIPENAPWASDWIEEHVSFPRGAHDDAVDTTSLALARLSKRNVWG
jgi:predicted phage terminase large subunit-like protein